MDKHDEFGPICDHGDPENEDQQPPQAEEPDPQTVEVTCSGGIQLPHIGAGQ